MKLTSTKHGSMKISSMKHGSIKLSSTKISPLKPLALAIRCASISAIAASTFSLAAAEVEPGLKVRITSGITANSHSHYTIAASSLPVALNSFAHHINEPVAMDDKLLKKFNTNGLQGSFTIAQGFAELLKNTGFQAKKTEFGYIIQKTAQNKQNVVGTLALTQVTGGAQFGDAPQEQGGFKAEYQSTTSKMAMRIIDTPQAISAVTRDALDARLVNNIASAVELTPSISSNNVSILGGAPPMFGGYGRASAGFSIRGLAADVRIDGFKSLTLSEDDGIDMAAFERIEVVRGPAGFYGAGSLGGFINKVRKKPQAEYGASLSVQAGSYDTYRAAGGITGAINDDETLRGRVDFAYDNAGAYVNDIESERLFIAPSIEAFISDNTRVLMQLTYQKDEFDENPGMPIQTVGNQIKVFDQFSNRTELYGSVGDKSSKESYIASLTVNHDLSEHWLMNLYLQNYKQENRFINGNYATVYSGYVYSSHKKINSETDNWAGELRLQGTFDAFEREHQIIFGIETSKVDLIHSINSGYMYISSLDDYSNNIGDYPVIPADEIAMPDGNSIEAINHGFYGQILLSLLDNTKLLMATRYDVAKSSGTSKWMINGNQKSSDNAWSSRLGIIQILNENINAYASYGQSFNPIDLFSNSRNGRLAPETGEGYEIGVKTEWFNNQLAANLSVYQQELDNRPIDDPSNDRDENFSISSGKHLTKGIELEVNGSFSPGWTIGASASLMDNEFTEQDDPYKGLSFIGTSDKQASLYTNYQVQQGHLTGLGIGATFVHIGKINHINESAEPYIQVYRDGYNRLDLNISYQGLANWDISLLVHNVTDENYLSKAYRTVGYLSAPRSVLLQATYNFD